VVLLHGTWWSRVWQPVIPALAERREVFALDFPGFGRSGGTLTREEADVPSLAATVLRFADAAGVDAPFAVVGHDIGGGVAQHLAAHAGERVDRLGLVNAVLHDSWPVPAVARFRDADVVAQTRLEDFVEQRGQSLDKGVARPLDRAVRDDYLSPLRSEDRMRSWIAMAAAADARFTRRSGPRWLSAPCRPRWSGAPTTGSSRRDVRALLVPRPAVCGRCTYALLRTMPIMEAVWPT
jgi:pimeloyl-ACP methyl ester carboxylesterase